MSRKFELRTRYGDRYYIHSNGNIERTDMKFAPSGQWKVIGIQHVKDSRYVPFDRLSDFLASNPTMTYKNGNPQWTVRDFDHGSTRVWGNTKYHGISSIRVVA